MKVDQKSLSFRIWHSLNGIAVLAALSTVALRKTFLSVKKNAPILQARLAKEGVVLTTEQARDAARAVRDGMWEWHYRIGFMLVFLLAFRLFFGKRSFPGFKSFREGAHAVYLLILGVMAATGISMYYSGILKLSEGAVDQIQEVHEFFLWFFPVFIVFHVAGVILAERKGEQGLILSVFSKLKV